MRIKNILIVLLLPIIFSCGKDNNEVVSNNNEEIYTSYSGKPPQSNSSSIGVYKANIVQSGTSNPSATEFVNTTDATGGWVRAGDGDYRLYGTFNQAKTYISGFGDFSDDGNPLMPITNGWAVIGYYSIFANGNSVTLFVYDLSFNNVDLNTLIGTSKFCVPVIEVYP